MDNGKRNVIIFVAAAVAAVIILAALYFMAGRQGGGSGDIVDEAQNGDSDGPEITIVYERRSTDEFRRDVPCEF